VMSRGSRQTGTREGYSDLALLESGIGHNANAVNGSSHRNERRQQDQHAKQLRRQPLARVLVRFAEVKHADPDGPCNGCDGVVEVVPRVPARKTDQITPDGAFDAIRRKYDGLSIFVKPELPNGMFLGSASGARSGLCRGPPAIMLRMFL
jgi:hypothetical protein